MISSITCLITLQKLFGKRQDLFHQRKRTCFKFKFLFTIFFFSLMKLKILTCLISDLVIRVYKKTEYGFSKLFHFLCLNEIFYWNKSRLFFFISVLMDVRQSKKISLVSTLDLDPYLSPDHIQSIADEMIENSSISNSLKRKGKNNRMFHFYII